MKTIISLFIFLVLTLGSFFRDNTFSLNIHDTYYVTSYLEIALVFVIGLLLFFLIKNLLRRLKNNDV